MHSIYLMMSTCLCVHYFAYFHFRKITFNKYKEVQPPLFVKKSLESSHCHRRKELSCLQLNSMPTALADFGGWGGEGPRGRPLLFRSNFLIFKQFSGKKWPNNRLAPHGKSWIRHWIGSGQISYDSLRSPSAKFLPFHVCFGRIG